MLPSPPPPLPAVTLAVVAVVALSDGADPEHRNCTAQDALEGRTPTGCIGEAGDEIVKLVRIHARLSVLSTMRRRDRPRQVCRTHSCRVAEERCVPVICAMAPIS